MATVAESPNEKPNSQHARSKALEEATPWIDYIVEQALLLQKRVELNVESSLEAWRSRVSQIRSTSSAHLSQTIDSLQDIKSEFHAYEDIAFRKIKEGVNLAASRPVQTAGVVTGLGVVVLRRPRRFLYYKMMHLLMSEESMLSRADAKVKELRQSIDQMKAESEKLERRAQVAEEEMIRGRTKLRQAGKQIQSVIRSAYKIEKKAGGLKDALRELPRREASRFRSQVSNVGSEAKRERSALAKEVSKISSYGISI